MERRHFSEPLEAYYMANFFGHARTEFILTESEWNTIGALANDQTNPNSEFLAELLKSNSVSGSRKGQHKIMFLDTKHERLLNNWTKIVEEQTNIKIGKTVERKIK